MHKPFVAWAWLVLGGMAAGCLVEPEGADGMDEPFLVDGKADGFAVEEGTGAACGVLRLADTADLVRLRATVGLDRRAAEALLAYRAGADGVEGTSDDERFDSLAELDGVRWIGPQSFARLLGQVVETGLACAEVELSLAAFSDWHGQLEPVATVSRGEVGGAAALSTYLSAERAADPSVLVLSAGDLFGASPPLSAQFGDRPAIDAANRLGFAAEVLGNHDFDGGLAHLAELAERAAFPLLAANLEGVAENLPCPGLPGGVCARPYATFWVHGLKVAVVGIATPDTVELVRPGALGTLTITEPAAAAQAAREAAAAEGARVFVALTHLDVRSTDEAGNPAGPLIDFARSAAGFDLVLGGHSHRDCVRRIDGRLVVQTRDAGVDFARISLRYDFSTHRVVSTWADLVPTPVAGVAPDAAVEAWLASLRAELAAVFDARVGVAESELGGAAPGPGRFELPIGNLVADALRWHTGVQVAFTNRGGIRGVLPSSYAPVDRSLRRPGSGYAAGPPWDLVLGDVRTLLPFGNRVVTRTVTGSQLWAICEHSVETLPASNSWFAQISGFRFTFSAARPAGSRVVSVELDDGTSVPADETRFTLATCDFVDQGGDGYAMLAGGDSTAGETMDAVLAAYLRAQGTVAPRVDGRILEVP